MPMRAISTDGVYILQLVLIIIDYASFFFKNDDKKNNYKKIHYFKTCED